MTQPPRGRTASLPATTGGGLWRYHLGDLVEVVGFLAATPSLRFLGRGGSVPARSSSSRTISSRRSPRLRTWQIAPGYWTRNARAPCRRLNPSEGSCVHTPLRPLSTITTEDGQRLTGPGQSELDSTAYGSHDGSGKLFRFLGQHLVNDLLHLHVKIHAEKPRL